jgi:hypothetical protein
LGASRMHRSLWTVALAAVLILGGDRNSWARQLPSAQGATPAESTTARAPLVTWSAGATFTSAFVWRGLVLADAPSVQPSASITIGGFTATSWVNLSAHGPLQGWSEHDLVVDYTHETGPWTLSVGYTNYYFPKTESGRFFTHEFYGIAALAIPLNPSVKVYHDVTLGRGTYVSAGVSQTLPLGSSKWSATPAVTLGYNNHQWVAGSGWSDLNLGLTLARPAGSHLDIAGSFNYSKSFHPEWFPSRAYVGVTVAVR